MGPVPTYKFGPIILYYITRQGTLEAFDPKTEIGTKLRGCCCGRVVFCELHIAWQNMISQLVNCCLFRRLIPTYWLIGVWHPIYQWDWHPSLQGKTCEIDSQWSVIVGGGLFCDESCHASASTFQHPCSLGLCAQDSWIGLERSTVESDHINSNLCNHRRCSARLSVKIFSTVNHSRPKCRKTLLSYRYNLRIAMDVVYW
jgi:hypothetical protein